MRKITQIVARAFSLSEITPAMIPPVERVKLVMTGVHVLPHSALPTQKKLLVCILISTTRLSHI